MFIGLLIRSHSLSGTYLIQFAMFNARMWSDRTTNLQHHLDRCINGHSIDILLPFLGSFIDGRLRSRRVGLDTDLCYGRLKCLELHLWYRLLYRKDNVFVVLRLSNLFEIHSSVRSVCAKVCIYIKSCVGPFPVVIEYFNHEAVGFKWFSVLLILNDTRKLANTWCLYRKLWWWYKLTL